MHEAYPGTRDIEQRKAAFDALFHNFASHIDNAAGLRRQADRTLAACAFWAGSHLFDDGKTAVCREYLELAKRIDPSMTRSPAWMRFQIKRLLGPSRWNAVRPMLNRLRGKAAPAA
jgi:hypothetical protein